MGSLDDPPPLHVTYTGTIRLNHGICDSGRAPSPKVGAVTGRDGRRGPGGTDFRLRPRVDTYETTTGVRDPTVTTPVPPCALTPSVPAGLLSVCECAWACIGGREFTCLRNVRVQLSSPPRLLRQRPGTTGYVPRQHYPRHSGVTVVMGCGSMDGPRHSISSTSVSHSPKTGFLRKEKRSTLRVETCRRTSLNPLALDERREGRLNPCQR